MTRKTTARFPLGLGYAAVIALVGGLGLWSTSTEIAGAVVARGIVEVENEHQVVQHPDGGVVGQILARNGDTVEAGDVLVELDDTFLLSELIVVEQQLVEFRARTARLVAERDDLITMTPPDLSDYDHIEEDWAQSHINGQADLFDARQLTLSEELDQLDKQSAQIDDELAGIDAQVEGLNTRLDIASAELEGLSDLFERGLVTAPRVLELRREEAELVGEIGALKSSAAKARTSQSAISVEKLNLVDTRRQDAISQLGDLEYSLIALEENRRSLVERLSRMDVRAPTAGTVFNSSVSTEGSVISAAQAMMFIVPQSGPLDISARVMPTDIEQVHKGQEVSLAFTSFSSRTAPKIHGHVAWVSADAETDEKTGFTYYEAVVEPDDEAIAAQPQLDLVPGMPVEVFLKTEDRTPLNYLLQPLTSYFDRAFR